MVISTQHLMPPPQSTDSTKQTPTTAAPTPGLAAIFNHMPQIDANRAGTLTPAKVESTSTDVLSMVIDMQSIPAPTDAPSEAVLEVIDVDDDSKLPTLHNLQHASQLQASTYPGGYSIDVCFEASKLPLDVAIFNSARAAGGDDKIRKYLQAVLVIGGTALIPGMAHALESR
jgi:actin-related protein 8